MPTAAQLRNFADLVQQAAQRHGDAVFLPRRGPREHRPTSFAELVGEIREIAAGLLAQGITKGTPVGLVAENRAEWLACDLACACIGAVDVPRGTDTPPAELEFILGHASCRAAFVEDEHALRGLLSRRGSLPELGTLFLMTAPPAGGEPLPADVVTLEQLRAAGRRLLTDDAEALARATDAVGRDDLLTVIYTSGTTANPKGVELTHGNLLENIDMVEDVLHFGPSDTALSILPSWHAYERIMDYVLLYAGAQLVYSDRRHVKPDLAAVRPTILVAVPRIWEMVHDGIVGAARKLTGTKRRLLNHALELARAKGRGELGIGGRIAHAIYERTLLPKVREAATGGRVRIAVSGGGALPAHVDERLVGLGLPLLNGYGLTETSPVVAVRHPETNRCGTIGPPLPRTQIEVRDEQGRALPVGQVGLIHIRGPQVMRGYHRNPEATRAVLGADGWFNSGDLGCLERDGHVRITGRAKDTIVLAGGENVEPERIETVLKTSPLIEQAVVVGQDRKHLAALIVPHREHLEHELPHDRWDESDGQLKATTVRELFRKEIDRLITAENGFRSLERIGGFQLLSEPLTPDNGLLTQTLKVRRHVVHERFAGLIEALYGV
ncbi:MAG: long-chain fatty acid--CoA ligase [Planctomycetes bacterium]|nr:long-chain fatty acid--CoA ligase [Planctomycetota bacterium]